MERNAKNLCRTVISGEEPNSTIRINKFLINKWLNLELSYFLHIFGQIQYFFKVLKTNFTTHVVFQYFQYRVGTLLLKRIYDA